MVEKKRGRSKSCSYYQMTIFDWLKVLQDQDLPPPLPPKRVSEKERTK